ncbi:MAG: peptide deformylase [Bacteriovoracaceae bacterium]|nr:peptide deformylase [Bacteriovoracaceae bacterium]
MAILEIIRMGNPILRQAAQDVAADEIGSGPLNQFIEDMIETMHEAKGLGLAAPQVGVSKNLVLIEIPNDSERYPGLEEFGLQVLINPKIKLLDKKKEGFWEGCLSIPGLRGYVRRPRKIEVKYLDHEGNPQEIVADDFLATVFQHEVDHLRGKLYIDRIEDTRKLVFEREYDEFIYEGDDDDDEESED